MNGVVGPEGRLLSRTHTSGVETVPEVCLEGSGMAIQGPLLWPFNGSTSIYESYGSIGSDPTWERHQDVKISRRLADSTQRQDAVGSGEEFSNWQTPIATLHTYMHM